MEKIVFENNPEFIEVFDSKVHGQKFYMPSDIADGYHLSRFVAGGAQDIFSNAGTTKDYLKQIANQIKEWCNDAKLMELRTNVGTLMDNLLYRLQYPVDEFCLLRMGAIFCFVDGEDPNKVQDFWTQRKMSWALGNYEKNIEADPELYDFFLSMGLRYTPSYRELLSTLTDTNYLKEREIVLQSLLPDQLRSK